MYGKPGGRIAGIFKFQITGLSPDAQIQKALLRVYADTLKGDGGEFTVFSASHSDWEETSVTWNNGPTRGNVIDSLQIAHEGQYYEFDVTEYLRDEAEGGASAISLWIEDAQVGWYRVEFDGSRSDQHNPPQLRVLIASSAPATSPASATTTTSQPTPEPPTLTFELVAPGSMCKGGETGKINRNGMTAEECAMGCSELQGCQFFSLKSKYCKLYANCALKTKSGWSTYQIGTASY